MANIIQHKRSSVAGNSPTAAQIEVGELAINLADKKIFTKDGTNTVIELGGGGSSKWTDTGADIYRNSKVRVGGTAAPVAELDVTGNAAISGDVAVNGGDITTTAATFNLLDTAATTINFGGSATAIDIGAATGTTAVRNNLTVDGNTTIGDAAADTITANASTMAVPNNLNIDNNTMFIDAANNRVGFGTVTPTTPLEVNGNVTITDKIIHAGDIDTAIRFPAADTFTVETAGLERVRVAPTGEVGFGTATPATHAQVDVDGTAAHNVVALGSGAMDLAVGQMFTRTVAAAGSWSFANVPAARGMTVVLHLTDGGTAAQTWPASVKWPGGTAPTLTAAGTDVLVFVTHDGGTTWRGNLFGKDVK